MIPLPLAVVHYLHLQQLVLHWQLLRCQLRALLKPFAQVFLQQPLLVQGCFQRILIPLEKWVVDLEVPREDQGVACLDFREVVLTVGLRAVQLEGQAEVRLVDHWADLMVVLMVVPKEGPMGGHLEDPMEVRSADLMVDQMVVPKEGPRADLMEDHLVGPKAGHLEAQMVARLVSLQQQVRILQ